MFPEVGGVDVKGQGLSCHDLDGHHRRIAFVLIAHILVWFLDLDLVSTGRQN